jgi:DNA-binding transcriptional LysR family regulator
MAEAQGARLTLRAVEIFVAVVDEASLGAGARRMGASASAVSQQIVNLEEALGARLIDRAARPFALTPAGQLFHPRALAILDEIGKARAELADGAPASFRKLRLALVDDIDQDVQPRFLCELADAFPDCRFTVRSGLSHENQAALESRSVDMIVAADMDNTEEWLQRHAVLRDPFILVTAKDLIDPMRDVMTQLKDRPFIRYGLDQVVAKLIEAHLKRLRIDPPRTFEITSNVAVQATTATARGWTVTTPLGFLSARRQHAVLDAHPLPFAGFSRTLSIYARRDVMGALPERAAELLRVLFQRHSIADALAFMPWLEDQFRVLDEEEWGKAGQG